MDYVKDLKEAIDEYYKENNNELLIPN
jgi:hypothetical protein